MKKIVCILTSLFLTTTLFGCSKGEMVVLEEKKRSTLSKLSIQAENGIDDFDLAFLKQIQKDENQIYSPLSIKYALCMLKEAASGKTREELDSIVGEYVPSVYENSKNLSLANLFAIKDTIASDVDEALVNSLQSKYQAEILVDSFQSPDKINDWIEEKTLGMIEKYNKELDPNLEFLMINALAIDMEWKNKIQDYFEYSAKHENFVDFVDLYTDPQKQTTTFDGNTVEGVQISAIANNYDIVSELGEDTIRDTVKKDMLEKYKNNDSGIQNLQNWYRIDDINTLIETYLDDYINDLKANYGYYGQSTDFFYYDDEEIKVFAKDLKEYNGTTFEYIGIMPKTTSLSDYISSLDAKKINAIVDSLIDPSTATFEEGYLTHITGSFPIFSYDYSLDLDSCLKEQGLESMYKSSNDFQTITTSPIIIQTSHKSKIDFSNEGIKAAAVTQIGGLGGAAANYDYEFDIPVKEIDLTFDQPFLYLIRNKETGDLWFIGTVYEGIQE